MKKIFISAISKINSNRIRIQYGINLDGNVCVRITNGQGFTINNNGNTKSYLRWINKSAKLSIPIYNTNGTAKNTHQLAQHIIKAINNNLN